MAIPRRHHAAGMSRWLVPLLAVLMLGFAGTAQAADLGAESGSGIATEGTVSTVQVDDTTAVSEVTVDETVSPTTDPATSGSDGGTTEIVPTDGAATDAEPLPSDLGVADPVPPALDSGASQPAENTTSTPTTPPAEAVVAPVDTTAAPPTAEVPADLPPPELPAAQIAPPTSPSFAAPASLTETIFGPVSSLALLSASRERTSALRKSDRPQPGAHSQRSPAPVKDSSPAPPAPSAPAGSAGSAPAPASGGSPGFGALGAVAALVGLAAAGLGRRIRYSRTVWRPVAFVSPLERPG